MFLLIIFGFTLALGSVMSYEDIDKPNIVCIVADDLGWNDVSFHGSDLIMTPNIDMIAYQGVILEQYYTDTQGTPSRSAFFTGQYPLRLGTQSISIKGAEDRGIPISERLLPAYLRDLGYATHLIGKWHVGKSREHYLPTYRGFDTFYGFLGGSVDYFTYNLIENWNRSSFYGLDFFDNEYPATDQTGHLTEILTERAVQIIRDHNSTDQPLYLHLSHAAPHTGGGLVNLQPSADTIPANDHIAHSARRLYAGLVMGVDKSIGRIVSALSETGMLDNTVIVFISDNGAPTTGVTQNFGTNLPLRGIKNTPWEGGMRSIGLLWHSTLASGTYHGLFHVTDWLPTLVAAAGGEVKTNIDGLNHWDTLTRDSVGPSPRNEMLLTIDDLNGWAAYREGEYKIIVGDLSQATNDYPGLAFKYFRSEAPDYEETLFNSETSRVFRDTLEMMLDVDEAFMKRNESNLLLQIMTANEDAQPCIPTKQKGCLFNISGDPYETRDLWYSSPDTVKRLTLRLRTLWTELKPRRQPQPDFRADPAKHDFIWSPWVNSDELEMEPLKTIPEFPLQVSYGELEYLVNLNIDMFKEKIYESIKTMGKSFVKSVSGLFAF